MRTLEDALDQLAYHPANPEVAEKYAAMRAECARLVKNTWDLIPDGPEKTLAMRGLQQFLMHANLAIALTTPADYANPHIARTLPPEDASTDWGKWQCGKCEGTYTHRDTQILCCAGHHEYGTICQKCAHELHPDKY